MVTDPDGSIEGWVPTDDGAISVGEPQGSPGWFPCNDNPQDKATYDFAVTVPAGLTAMANGVLVSSTTSGDTTTWTWHEADPMATYLATVDVGVFDLTISTVDGIPSYVAVDPQLAKGQVLSKLPDIVRFYSSIYGPYPFTAVGAIVDSAKNLGYSLETQTKPLFPYVPNEATLAHELSHMWFGDSATLGRWPDMWLHEGFATWSEWIWSEYTGRKSAAQYFKQLYSTSAKDLAFWNPPPGDPGTPELLFNGTIYYRGAMTLEALREKIGDDETFFRIMYCPGAGEPVRHRDDPRVHRHRRTRVRAPARRLLPDVALHPGQADELVGLAATTTVGSRGDFCDVRPRHSDRSGHLRGARRSIRRSPPICPRHMLQRGTPSIQWCSSCAGCASLNCWTTRQSWRCAHPQRQPPGLMRQRSRN